MKTINDSPADFFREGGWSFLQPASSDEDESDEESAYEEDSDDFESESEDSEDDYSSDDSESDFSENSDDEEEGEDWDELEKKAARVGDIHIYFTLDFVNFRILTNTTFHNIKLG